MEIEKFNIYFLFYFLLRNFLNTFTIMKIYQFDKTKFNVREIRQGNHSERTKKIRRKIFQQHFKRYIKHLEKE